MTFSDYMKEAPHIEFANQFIDLEAEQHHIIPRLIKILLGQEVKDKHGSSFQLKKEKDILAFVKDIIKNPFVKRFLSKEIKGKLFGESLNKQIGEIIEESECLLEFVVPMGWSLSDWKAHKKEKNINNSEYHKQNPDKNWTVVHGTKKGKVGEPIEGATNMSYKEASKMHQAIVISQGK